MHFELKDICLLSDPISGKIKETRLRVSCRFSSTEKIGIIGHSGSGKTTLLQVVAGLLEADSGQILFGDEQINNNKRLKLKYQNQFGICFQFPEMQLFEQTVSADIAFGLHHSTLGAEEKRTRVEETLASVGLNPIDYYHKPLRSLSQGEKRRVAIAGILVMQKRVLLLDEPTAGLDAQGVSMVKSLLRRYTTSPGKGMLVVSHDLEFLLQIVDKLWLMQHGSLLHSMSRAAIDFTILQDYIELPRSYYLQKKLSSMGIAWPAPE